VAIRAFGFKIFYDHARADTASKTIWQYFAANPIRIIHLHGKNLLASYVSNEVALKTNEWLVAANAPRPAGAKVPRFPIDPALVERYFDEITNWRRWADQTFAKHEMLNLSYEDDLCRDFAAAADAAYRFIGVIPWVSRPGLQKQQTVTLEQQISNFAALKRHFRNTPYAGFFDCEGPDSSKTEGRGSPPSGWLANLFGRPRDSASRS